MRRKGEEGELAGDLGRGGSRRYGGDAKQRRGSGGELGDERSRRRWHGQRARFGGPQMGLAGPRGSGDTGEAMWPGLSGSRQRGRRCWPVRWRQVVSRGWRGAEMEGSGGADDWATRKTRWEEAEGQKWQGRRLYIERS